MSAFDHLADLHPMCDRGCGRTMDDCYEAEDGADCDGGELWQEVNRLNAEAGLLRAELARAKPVLDAAQAWRRWFPFPDSMFVPENALIAAVDAHRLSECVDETADDIEEDLRTEHKLPVCADCGHRHRWGGECADHSWDDTCPYDAGADCEAGAGHTQAVAGEPDLIIYQAWDCDEIGWSDDNGMSGTDVEAVKLAALESFVAWSIEENWCGDPDEVDRFEAELREGLHWRQVGKAWELHRGTQGRSTWQGINIFPMKVGRDTVADIQAKCAKAKADRRAADGLSSTDTTEVGCG